MKTDAPDESPVASDPELRDRLEATLASYRGLLPEGALEEMRELLEDTLGSHPAAVLLRRRLGPVKAPLQSGESPTADASGAEDAEAPTGRRSAGGDR